MTIQENDEFAIADAQLFTNNLGKDTRGVTRPGRGFKFLLENGSCISVIEARNCSRIFDGFDVVVTPGPNEKDQEDAHYSVSNARGLFALLFGETP